MNPGLPTNLSDRSADGAIDMVVLHYTGMPPAPPLSACATRRRRSAPTTWWMRTAGCSAGVGGQKCLACGGKLLAGRNRHQRPVGRHD